MKKTFEITVDMEKQTTNPSFSVSQNDLNSIELDFTLTQDQMPVDLTGCLVRMAIKKPSGKVVFQDCTIADAAAGSVYVILSTQGYSEVGLHTAEIMVSKDSEVAVTGSFQYTSRTAILNDTTLESNNDFQALAKLLLSITNAYSKEEIDAFLAQLTAAVGGKADASAVEGKADASAVDGKVSKINAGNADVKAGDFTYTFGLDSGFYAPIFVEGGTNLSNKYQAVTLTGSGSPVGMAWINKIGQFYIDIDSKKVWIAVGENAATDWKQIA